MNTSELQCCIDCSSVLKKHVVGVFAADQLPSKRSHSFGFIANTDNHNMEGKHWCSFYFPNQNIVEFFDSYGKSIDYYNSYFHEYVSTVSSVTVNSKQLQSVNSDVCGMYCLFFLMHRVNCVSFHDIVNMFSKNTEYNDEFVYENIVNSFPACTANHCIYNQSCKPLIKFCNL